MTLTSGEVTVEVGSGTRHAGATLFTVISQRTVAGAASALLPGSSGTRTITRSGAAEAWTSTATSASSSPCILALDTASAQALKVDNMGSIKGTGCATFADSTASNAIYLNSGAIVGSRIGTAGGIQITNSGSNTFSPFPGRTIQATVANPYAALTIPSPGPCSYNNASFTAWSATPYAFTQSKNVFCGNTTIGGNASTATFEPGVYYVVNGNLVFNNATIRQASGVTFVLTGTSPGAIQWTNYSNTSTSITAPSSGPTAGIAFWQGCPSSGNAPDNSMAGGSTLVLAGTFYAPCGALNMSNNARLQGQSG